MISVASFPNMPLQYTSMQCSIQIRAAVYKYVSLQIYEVYKYVRTEVYISHRLLDPPYSRNLDIINAFEWNP